MNRLSSDSDLLSFVVIVVTSYVGVVVVVDVVVAAVVVVVVKMNVCVFVLFLCLCFSYWKMFWELWGKVGLLKKNQLMNPPLSSTV